MLPTQLIAFPALQTQLRALASIQRPDGKPQYFFRGQSQHWPNAVSPSITPTIDRPTLSQTARNQALTVCLEAKLLGRGIDGYPIPTIEHAIGILRHYSWPTPALDITDDPDVALWFALNNRANGGQAYVLVLDSTTFAQEGIEGRVALGVAPQSSHRAGRADFPHPVRHVVAPLSLTRPSGLAVTRLRGSVSSAWFQPLATTRRPLRSTGSGRARSPASTLL